MKKMIIYVLIAVIIAILVYVAKIAIGGMIIGGGGIFNFPIGKEKMENIFEKDRELLATVKNYLANSDYNSIYIPSTINSDEMSVEGKATAIEDAEIVNAINMLKKQGYSVIGKNGNTIYFQRWSNLDNGRGVAYSIDGGDLILKFLTKTESLSEPNWYYYEEDYNEWRIRNKQ